jgi:hypothetical protein
MKLDLLPDKVALAVQLIPIELLPVGSFLLVSLSRPSAIHLRRAPRRTPPSSLPFAI